MKRACRVAGISCSVYRCLPKTDCDDEFIAGIQSAIAKYPPHSFSKVFNILRCGWSTFGTISEYKSCKPNLNKRRIDEKRVVKCDAIQLCRVATFNACWLIVFISDSLFFG